MTTEEKIKGLRNQWYTYIHKTIFFCFKGIALGEKINIHIDMASFFFFHLKLPKAERDQHFQVGLSLIFNFHVKGWTGLVGFFCFVFFLW